MKITVVGFITVVALVVVLGLLAYQVGTEIDKSRQNNNGQPNGSV